MKSAIEKLNYEVKDLVLAREIKVPDDATIVVVAGPQRELLPNEIDAWWATWPGPARSSSWSIRSRTPGSDRSSSGGGSASGTT